MNRCFRLSFFLLLSASLAFIALSGCTPAKKTEDGHKHGHPPEGPHGGPLADWDDKYHFEFIVDSAKKEVTIYVLDEKAAKAPAVDAAKFKDLKLTILGTPPIDVPLTHDKEASGEKGIAFKGKHDKFEKPAGLKVNIGGSVDGKNYNEAVEYKAPAKTASLFLTPGGIYTAADVKANGNTTPAEKFKGIEWTHDDNLKVGDKICPITKKKAQAECAWVVAGQSYEFCCEPCIKNFMKWAHDDEMAKTKIKKASDYVHRGT